MLCVVIVDVIIVVIIIIIIIIIITMVNCAPHISRDNVFELAPSLLTLKSNIYIYIYIYNL